MYGKNSLFRLSFIFIFLISITQSYAQPHSHGGRSHNHSLPAQGLEHRHGTGALGKNSGQTSSSVVIEKASGRSITQDFVNNFPKKTVIKNIKGQEYAVDQKGCLHASFNRISVTWTGNCVKGFASGYGIQRSIQPCGGSCTSPLRVIFEGTMKSGNKIKGLQYSKNSFNIISSFEGTYKYNTPDKGIVFRNGIKYSQDGSKENRVSSQRSRGTKIYPNGNKFTGAFFTDTDRLDQPKNGTMNYSNGDVFTGSFAQSVTVRGAPKTGKMRFINGDVFKGTFAFGTRIPFNGRMIFSDGRTATYNSGVRRLSSNSNSSRSYSSSNSNSGTTSVPDAMKCIIQRGKVLHNSCDYNVRINYCYPKKYVFSSSYKPYPKTCNTKPKRYYSHSNIIPAKNKVDIPYGDRRKFSYAACPTKYPPRPRKFVLIVSDNKNTYSCVIENHSRHDF